MFDAISGEVLSPHCYFPRLTAHRMIPLTAEEAVYSSVPDDGYSVIQF